MSHHRVAVFQEEGGWVFDCFCGATSKRRASNRKGAWLDAFSYHRDHMDSEVFQDRLVEAGWIHRSISLFDEDTLVPARPKHIAYFGTDRAYFEDPIVTRMVEQVYENEERWWEK